jgi:hypothetical protein
VALAVGVGDAVAVGVTEAVAVVVTVGVGVGTPTSSVALAQSSTSMPSASCAAAHTLMDQVPGSEIVVVTDIVLVSPTARPLLSTHAAKPVSGSMLPPSLALTSSSPLGRSEST